MPSYMLVARRENGIGEVALDSTDKKPLSWTKGVLTVQERNRMFAKFGDDGVMVYDLKPVE